MNKLKLKFIGYGDFDTPVYSTEDGKLFADINLGKGSLSLCTLTNNEIDGEPNIPIEKLKKYEGLKIEIIGRENEPTAEERFIYQMLSRLQMDCNYYLGNGNRYAPHLWANDEKDNITEMKKLWNKLDKDKKPEWLTWEDILNYEKQMCI